MGRTIFIVLSVTVAAWASLMVVTVLKGMSNNLRDAVVKNNVGDFQFQELSYAQSSLSGHPLEYTSDWEERLKQENIQNPSPELVMEGFLSTPEGDAALTVLGIEPLMHGKFIPLESSIKAGNFFKGTDPRPAVIGDELAKEFKLTVGESLVLNFQDHEGQLRSEQVTVVGIFDYSSRSFQGHYLYLLQRDWQELYLGTYNGKILFNRIPFMGRNLSMDNLVKIGDGRGVKLKSWQDENPEMSVAVDFNDLMIRFCLLITSFTVLLTIMGPVQILWEERAAELKTLRILGVGRQELMSIGLIEFILTFFISFSLSLFLIFLTFAISSKGIDLNFLNQGERIERAGIIIDWLIHPSLDVANFITPYVLVFLVLLLSYVSGLTTVLKRLDKEPA